MPTDWRLPFYPSLPRWLRSYRATSKRHRGPYVAPYPKISKRLSRETDALKPYADHVVYARLLREARPYWPHIAGIFLLSLLSTPLALLLPFPLKLAVDSVIGAHPLPPLVAAVLPASARDSGTAVLLFAAGLLVAVTLLVYLQAVASSILQTYTGEKLVLEFRARLFRHVQRLSLAYHDTKGTADSTYRIQYDAPAIQGIAIDGLIRLIAAGFTLLGMIYVTARLDWQLALVALAICPPLFLLTQTFRPRLRRRWREIKKLDSSAMSVVQEVLSSVRVVKAFGQEDREHGRFVQHSNQRVLEQIRLMFFQGGLDTVVGLTLAVGTAAALFVGALHVRNGALTLGELLVVMAYLAQLYEPLKTFSKKVTELQSGLASAERAFSLLDELPEVIERPNARPLARASGAVLFRGVSFSYEKGLPALQDISFEVAPGSRVGIAGRTGAGKTTLASLLMRFYDPTAGQILLDGADLREYKLADLRNQFAMVLQDSVLFSATIAENIAYARPEATQEEIEEAAKVANAHEFILSLPEGYQTLVGERGMRLSGGERQRISLARAFLKDAPILILDEPTSSVDLRTEAAILEAMERLMRGRTTITIAHRLSTLENCDLRLEIEGGQLVSMTGSCKTTKRTSAVV
jgi:ATP-binding cassette subfamily B protein